MMEKINAAVKSIMTHLLVISAALFVSCWSGFDDMCTGVDKSDPDNIKLTVMNSGANSLTIDWQEPSFPAYSHAVITWSPDGGTDGITLNKGESTVTISSLATTTEYTVTIRSYYTTGYISGESSFKVTTGSGIVQFAYLPGEVDAVRDNLSGSYILMADVDLDDYSSGTGWTPIGNAANPYTGRFDGNGHIVSNLTINNPGTSAQGFFGNADGATIKNLDLENVNITGNKTIGGLAGKIQNSTAVSNCTVSGCVTGSDYGVGGLIGWALDSTCTDSSSSVTVSGTRGVGCFVGTTDNGIFTRCFSTGSVTATSDDIGGFMGNMTGTASVTDCYSTGSVKSTGSETGGFVGNIFNGTITDCHASGDVSGSKEKIGGFAGSLDGSTTSISRCYAAGTVNGCISGTATKVSCVGGFVGYIWNKETPAIISCYATGDVMATALTAESFGGFAGFHWKCITSQCFATGNVTIQTGGTGKYFGGFAGFSTGSTCTISDCYATGKVTGTDYVGGFTGYHQDYAEIQNSYAIGEVSIATNRGGFTGGNVATINNSFYDTQTTGCSDTGTGFTPTSTDNMKKTATFTVVGWDFTNDWNISASVNNGYPYLR